MHLTEIILKWDSKSYQKGVVDYTNGLPLALKLIGSSLHSRCKEAWKSALENLQKDPHKRIENVLRLSYDGLSENEQEIFLDIAFFFKGESVEDVKNFLGACKFSATIGLDILQDKALITISDSDKVEMHDLIREMGWEIEREKSKDPGKRSRLRDLEEVCDVLKKNKGSDVIEGIILDVSQIKDDLYLSGDVFKKMTKLRFLKFYSHLYLIGSPSVSKIYPSDDDSFSDSLRYFRWDEYPLKFLPQTLCLGMLVELHIMGGHVESLDDRAQDLANLKRINLHCCQRLLGVRITFCAEKLVHLDMSNTLIEKLWDGAQEFVSLKEIDLIGCRKLTELPDFSKASKLRVVDLSGCVSLRCIHPSLLSLQSLYKLDLSCCNNLRSLQSRIPPDNLVFLSLRGCFSLEEFSLSSVNIQELDLSDTTIETLASSIGRCSNLKNLFLNRDVKFLPNELSNLQSLERLDISGCRELDTWNLHIIFDGLCSLQDLILDGTNVESLPDCIKHLPSLEYIAISNCKRLQSLPELPPSLKRLVADNCPSLETVTTPTTLNSCKTVLDKPFGMSFRNCMKLDERSLHAIATHARKRIKLVAACQCGHCIGFCFPGNKVPRWFTNQIIRSSITIELPSRSDLLGFALCVVLSLEFSTYVADRFYRFPLLEIECKCYLEDSEIVTRAYTMLCPRERRRVLLPDHVILWYDETDSEAMMKAIRDRIPKHTSYNPKLLFQFSARVEGNPMLDDAIKECGVWPIYASERDYPEEEMEVLGLGNKTKKCEDMDRAAKKLKPTFLTTGMELELEADIDEFDTDEIGVGGSELKEFISQPLPIDICMQNGRQDLTEINFNCLLNRCSELDKTIKEGRLLSIDASESHNSTNKMELNCELLELGLDHKSKRNEYDLDADEQQLHLTKNCEQPVPLGSKFKLEKNPQKYLFSELDKKEDHRVLSVSVDVSESHDSINPMESYLELESGSGHQSNRSVYNVEADMQQGEEMEREPSNELELLREGLRGRDRDNGSVYDVEADMQRGAKRQREPSNELELLREGPRDRDRDNGSVYDVEAEMQRWAEMESELLNELELLRERFQGRDRDNGSVYDDPGAEMELELPRHM